MKKTLLLACAALAATGAMALTPVNSAHKSAYFCNGKLFEGISAPAKQDNGKKITRAGESQYVFSYDNGVGTAYTIPTPDGNSSVSSGVISCAMQFKEDDLKILAGKKITAIRFYSPITQNYSNPITNGFVWISSDISQAPTVRKGGKLNPKGFGENVFTLDEPFVIPSDGKPLYVGYTFQLNRTTCYYVVTDAMPVEGENNTILGYNNKLLEQPTNWKNYASSMGSLCIGVYLEGDNLPQNRLRILESSIADFVQPGTDLSYTLAVRNAGANEISAFNVITKVGENTDTRKVTLKEPIPASSIGEVSVDGIKISEPGLYNVEISIPSLNDDAPNYYAADKTSGYVSVYDSKSGFPQKMVYEDATGTWCQWCPSGIVMLEEARKSFPDVIYPIGVHYGDDMQINSYMGFLQDYIEGFPTIVINRKYSISPGNYTGPQMKSILQEQVAQVTQIDSYGKVDLYVKSVEDGKNAEVSADAQIILDTDVPHYLSFVIVEDGVGPYDQNNNVYAGGAYCEMGEWSKTDEKAVSTIFNDVARAYRSYPGIPNSLPATLKKGQTYNYKMSIPLTDVTGNSYRVIALLTNAETGFIVNAALADCTKDNSAVSDILDDNRSNISVVAGKGMISVNGAENVEVYSLDGRKSTTTNLLPGLYIVKADGKSFKVMVK